MKNEKMNFNEFEKEEHRIINRISMDCFLVIQNLAKLILTYSIEKEIELNKNIMEFYKKEMDKKFNESLEIMEGSSVIVPRLKGMLRQLILIEEQIKLQKDESCQ